MLDIGHEFPYTNYEWWDGFDGPKRVMFFHFYSTVDKTEDILITLDWQKTVDNHWLDKLGINWDETKTTEEIYYIVNELEKLNNV